MANSYELLLKIGGQLENSFGKSINSATKSLSGIGKTVSSVKNVVVGALGAAGVGLSLKGLIDAGGEAEQTGAQMNAVLKSTHGAAGMTAKQLDALAAAQQGVTTYSENTTKQAENMLLTFTGIGKKVFPQTIQATEDMATAMHMDATQAAMTLGKALNDPAKGLSRLTKQGVTFTDSQKKQIQAMQKTGNVAGAQSIILQEVEREFGGSAKAAGQTVSGQMAIIRNTMHSTMEQIGLLILPTIRAILPQITGLLKQAATNLAAHQQDIKRWLSQLAAAATAVFTKVIPAIASAVRKVIPAIVNAGKRVFPLIKSIFNFIISHKDLVIAAIAGIGAVMGALKVGKIFTEFTRGMKAIGPTTTLVSKLGFAFTDLKTSPTILKGLSNGFKDITGFNPKLLLIAAAIAAIAALAFLIVKNWGPISGFFKNLWSGVVSAFNSAKSAIGNVINAIGGFFKQWGPLILTFVAPVLGVPLLIIQHWSKIRSFFQGLWTGIRSVFQTATAPIVKSVIGPLNTLKTGISNIMNGIKNIFRGAWTIIKNIVSVPVLLICDLISGHFGKIPSDMAKIWNNVKSGALQAWNGIKSVVLGVAQAIAGTLGTTFSGCVALLQSIGSGLASFFTGLWNGIKSTAVSVWGGLISFFSSLPSRFTGFMSGIGNAIIHGFDSAINFIKSLPSKMLQWGKDMINGLINGIKGAIGGVQQAASNVASTVRSFLHFSVPDTGPLKDAASYGPDFMKLYSNGITKNIPTLKRAAQAAAKGANSGIQMPLSKVPLPISSGIGGRSNAQRSQPVVIHYAPQVIIQGSASKEDVRQTLDDDQRKFAKNIQKWRDEMKRKTGKDPIPV